MSISAETLFQVNSATYIELHNLLVQIVSQHALQHVSAGSSGDANTEISNVLSTNMKDLKNMPLTKGETMNVDLLFANPDRTILKNKIDISKMDCSMLLNILLYFPGFTASSTKRHKCAPCVHNKNKCCGKCKHSSNKTCTNCKITKRKCDEYSQTCSKVGCMVCLECNEKAFKQLVQKSPTTFLPCPSFLYVKCLEMLRQFRNLFYAHSTISQCEDLVNGTSQMKIDSITFTTTEELKKFLMTIFVLIWENLTDANQWQTPFTEIKKTTFLDGINCIFKNNQSRQMYVQSNMERIKTIQDEFRKSAIHEDMESMNKNLEVKISNRVENLTLAIWVLIVILVALFAVVVTVIIDFRTVKDGTESVFKKNDNPLAAKEELCKIYNSIIERKQSIFPLSNVHREKFYIQMSLHDGEMFPKENEIHQKRFLQHRKMSNQNRTNVNIANILSNKKEGRILISSPGGFGKTYMIEEAICLWCQDQIWTSVKFVFLFRFREMNNMEYSSFKEMVEIEYETVFHQISWNNLTKMGEEIVVILDGLDEFIGIDELNFQGKLSSKIQKTPITQTIRNFLNPSLKTLVGHYLLITGRSFAIETFYKQLLSRSKPIYFKVYEILGFTEAQVDEYIRTYNKKFPDTSSAMKDLNSSLHQSVHLQIMSRTPVLLASLCDLYAETHKDDIESLRSVTTKTELFALQLTLFLRKHLKVKEETLNLSDGLFGIYKSLEIRQLIFQLAELAADMYGKGLAFIPLDEMLKKKIPIKSLEISGIISQVQMKSGKIFVQFHHLSIQEFLMTLHHLRNYVMFNISFLQEKAYIFQNAMLPFYSGLLGASSAEVEGCSQVLQSFLEALDLKIINHTIDIEIVKIARKTSSRIYLELIYEFKSTLSQQTIQKSCFKRIFRFSDSFFLQHFLRRYTGECMLSLHLDGGIISETTLKHVCEIESIEINFLKGCNKKDLTSLKTELFKCKSRDSFKRIRLGFTFSSTTQFAESCSYNSFCISCHKTVFSTDYLNSGLLLGFLRKHIMTNRCQKHFKLQSLSMSMAFTRSNWIRNFPTNRYRKMIEFSLYIRHVKFLVPGVGNLDYFKYLLNSETTFYRRVKFDSKCKNKPIQLRSITISIEQFNVSSLFGKNYITIYRYIFYPFPTKTGLKWQYILER